MIISNTIVCKQSCRARDRFVGVYNGLHNEALESSISTIVVFIFFFIEHYDGLTRKMCLELNAVVISIE